MEKWFKGYYYDVDYHGVTADYYLDVISKGPNSSQFCGGKLIGNHKKKDKEQLKKEKDLWAKKAAAAAKAYDEEADKMEAGLTAADGKTVNHP